MKRVLPNLALVAFSLALACGISEGVLRARYGAPPGWTFPQESYVPDPEIGFWLAPDQHAFTHDQPVETNSLGLRDREHPRLPAPGVRRLVALGDSQTFGNGLPADQTWPALLEDALQALGDPAEGTADWEVINAGLAGSATWQQELMLRRLLDAYRVDGFVVGFYVNDPVPRPQSVELAATELTNTWSKRAAYTLKQSALLLALWQARFPLHAWLEGGGSSWEQRILTGEPDPRVEAGWRQVEISLAAMRDLAADRDLAFWLVAIPRRDQVSGAEPGRDYQQRLARLAAKLDIALYDPLPGLMERYAEHGERLFIAWDGHNGPLANASIAEGLARAIAVGP